MHSILKDTLITVEAFKADADNETLTGVGVDMQGFDRVTFVAIAKQGNVGSPTIKAQQDTDSAFGTAADLVGTSATFTTGASADGITSLEIVEPRERYVRAIATIPNWNAVPVIVLAIRHCAREVPQANAGELHVSPAEGTA